MDRPAQLVYEGSRSFRKYDFTVEIVVINLYKYGVFEVLLRDHDSQCALPPVYLRSSTIEHRIRPADIETLMIDSRHMFDPHGHLNDDDLYDVVVRVSIFNYIADRLSIKKRAADSKEMYEVEYLPALYDPEFGPGKNRLDQLVCNDPYYWGAPTPLEKNLSLNKQGTADTAISSSVRGANVFVNPNNAEFSSSRSVSLRVNSALRTLTTLFGSGKTSNRRSVRPIAEHASKGAPSIATQSQSQSQSYSQSKSRSESQDPSDMAVHRMDSQQHSFRATSLDHTSSSHKNTHLSTKHTSTHTTNSTEGCKQPSASGSKVPYHESISGQRGQDLAHRMLSRLDDLPDIPDALLGTVIYFPAAAGTNSNKTVSQQERLAAYFQPLPELFASIEDLCDPRVIERIPFRLHPCLQPPKCVSRLSVDISEGPTEPESAKTEAYNHPTGQLTTSPQLGSPCLSVQEEERSDDLKKSHSSAGKSQKQTPTDIQVVFSAQQKPGTESSQDTKNHHLRTVPSSRDYNNTEKNGSEGQVARAVRPLVNMFRSVVGRTGRVGAAPADE